MRLIVRKDGQADKEFQIDKQLIHLGRSTDCDVPLVDRLVSRKHAAMKLSEPSGQWTIEDLGSSNKTYLNNAIITKSPLKSGDEIQIGEFFIEIDLDEKSEQPETDAAEETVDGEVLTMEASLTTPKSETVVRKPDAQHAPAMRLAARRLSDFSRATETLCNADSLDKMLVTLMDILVKQFDAFHVWCALREQPSGPMTYHAGKRRDGQKVEIADLQLQDKIVQAIEKKQSSVFPRVSAQMQEKDRIRSALIAPILRQNGCYGLLYVDNAMVHEHYSLSDLDYLMFIAMHTAAILKGLLDI
ncbi:MAG: FHA domain-containing protein [Phycisphaerales bacterium]|jgi:adenylate cyclase